MLREEADALPDSAADEVGGVTEEDEAALQAGAVGRQMVVVLGVSVHERRGRLLTPLDLWMWSGL